MSIIYTEKGNGLHTAINEAGHTLHQHDNVWVSSNDTEVQAIIDSYDPLTYEREAAKKRLIGEFEEATAELESQYPEVEKRTFIKQETEARTWLLDSNVSTPTLTPIASARGIGLNVVVSRVISKADEYTANVAALIGLRQAKEDLVDLETDWVVIRSTKLME